MKAFSVFLLGLFLAGCATSRSLWQNDLAAEAPAAVLDVPFVAQEKNLCGPVVLKMATHFSAPQYTLTDLKKITFREEAQGTFQSDILSASRRMGLTPYRVPSSAAIWSHIRQGRPVVVFQNMGVSWLPAWHFSLVVGYDAPKNQVLLHTGTEPYQSLGLKRFLATWNRGEQWSYVITQPQDVPAGTSFAEALENAMLLEKTHQPQAARTLYQTLSKKFPDQFEPYLGLAQISYAEKKLSRALRELETALEKSPRHPALLFNLSILHFEVGHIQRAQELKEQTLALLSGEERATYEERFKSWLH